MRVKFRWVALAGLFAFALAPGAGLRAGERGLEPLRLRGTITAVTAAPEELAELGIVGWIRLEVGGSLVSEPILVDVVITEMTTLARACQNDLVPVPFAALRKGQVVECAIEPILTPIEDPPLFARAVVIVGRAR